MELHLADVRDFLPTLEDNSVDLIVTDIPYPVTVGGNKNPKAPKGVLSSNNGKIFKHNSIKPNEYAHELYRVLKDGSHAYFFVNLRNLFLFHAMFENAGFKLHNLLIWQKNTVNPNRWYMMDKEFILFYRKGAIKTINNPGTKTILPFDNISGNKLHECEKPTDLLSVLILNSSQPGDVVLDSFMGSGSTGEACAATLREFIGVEIDPDYYNIAAKRLGVK